ncbi:MAG: thiamine pyrophosphate-dependent dehydrogenase E1 component subunit alpha, partial [Bauldia litoralis]
MTRKKAPKPPAGPPTGPPGELFLDLYRTMVLIRTFEEQVRSLHMGGLAPGLVHLYSGQEAVAAGVCANLRPDDWIASHHRGHGHCIAKGAALDRVLAEIMGRRPGYGLGRGGSMHILDPETRNLGTTGIVGGGIALAAGAALTARRQGRQDIAVGFFGDGALNQGVLFETMNLSAVWALPVIFVCENNGYGEFTETSNVSAGHPYTKRAVAFDMPFRRGDGMDAL